MTGYPRRIACLTEETTETLYLLGEQDRIVGISGYTVRPPEARLKPKISAFTSAKFEKIMAVEPDLVLAFSDLQADIVRELLVRGVTVFAFNQRSVEEILDMILTLARIVGVPEKARRSWRSSVPGLTPSPNPPRSSPAVPACCSRNGKTHSSAASAGSRN